MIRLPASYCSKTSGQYDTFLHEEQKVKMTERWNNKEDEAWEHA
jgi:hypothetical protein